MRWIFVWNDGIDHRLRLTLSSPLIGKSTQEDEAPVGPEKLDNPDYEEILEYQVLEEAPTGESQGDSPDKPLSTLLD